jgi:hypothetical protein
MVQKIRVLVDTSFLYPIVNPLFLLEADKSTGRLVCGKGWLHNIYLALYKSKKVSNGWIIFMSVGFVDYQIQ